MYVRYTYKIYETDTKTASGCRVVVVKCFYYEKQCMYVVQVISLLVKLIR